MRKNPPPYASVAFAALALCLSAWGDPAYADDDGRETRHEKSPAADERPEHEDYDHILKAVREGRILPLATLKATVLERWPGELVGVSVDRDKDRVIYEFRIVRGDGRMTEVEVDAANGKVIEIENE